MFLARKRDAMVHECFESCKRGHNIVELFDILPTFLFATIETERDY